MRMWLGVMGWEIMPLSISSPNPPHYPNIHMYLTPSVNINH